MSTLAAVDIGLRWKTGSGRVTLQGGEPTPLDVPDAEVVPPPPPTAAELQALIDSAQDNPLIRDALMAVLRLRDALDAARSEASPEKRNRESG
jgi:hypothetical protein